VILKLKTIVNDLHAGIREIKLYLSQIPSIKQDTNWTNPTKLLVHFQAYRTANLKAVSISRRVNRDSIMTSCRCEFYSRPTANSPDTVPSTLPPILYCLNT
jgi:hypothetical protein